MKKGLDKYFKSLYTTIMETLKELKKFDAVLRMSRFSTKRKGNDKKRLSKKLCRKKVSWEKWKAEMKLFSCLLYTSPSPRD